eukprot:1026421-Rhodomonas_salina.1
MSATSLARLSFLRALHAVSVADVACQESMYMLEKRQLGWLPPQVARRAFMTEVFCDVLIHNVL